MLQISSCGNRYGTWACPLGEKGRAGKAVFEFEGDMRVARGQLALARATADEVSLWVT